MTLKFESNETVFNMKLLLIHDVSRNICVSAFQGGTHQLLISKILGTRHHTHAKCKNRARRE